MATKIRFPVTLIVLLFYFEGSKNTRLHHVKANSFWNAGTLVTTATDLLEQSDLLLRDRRDPLLRVIEESSHRYQVQDQASGEKFLLPLLSDTVGFNNQLMEYMTAAVIARATNRTLCLTPFHMGPLRHVDRKSKNPINLAIEDHYNVIHLSKLVRSSNLERCYRRCNKKLDNILMLRAAREVDIQMWNVKTESHNLDWSFVNWTTITDIARDLSFSQERCIALGGLFPGLRWRGAFLAMAEYLHPTSPILDAATSLQHKAIGSNDSFLAVHWRFEESNCNGHPLGLCFVRCGDGSIVDSGLHPPAQEWVRNSKRKCSGRFRGVAVTAEDIINAITDRAKKYNLHNVYLATDGWMRGGDSQRLLEQVVNHLRHSKFAVAGLWKIKRLPNFPDGTYFNFSTLPQVGNNAPSLIEQELCSRATSFLGSGQSTWSLTVFRSRLAARRSHQIKHLLEQQQQKHTSDTYQSKLTSNEIDDYVINALMRDEHAAGMQCRYQSFYNRVRVSATVETYQDEEPDGWLDLEACEKRIGRGGQCKVAAC